MQRVPYCKDDGMRLKPCYYRIRSGTFCQILLPLTLKRQCQKKTCSMLRGNGLPCTRCLLNFSQRMPGSFSGCVRAGSCSWVNKRERDRKALQLFSVVLGSGSFPSKASLLPSSIISLLPLFPVHSYPLVVRQNLPSRRLRLASIPHRVPIP